MVRDYEEDCEKKRTGEKDICKAVIGHAMLLSVDYIMSLYAGCGICFSGRAKSRRRRRGADGVRGKEVDIIRFT